MSHVLIIVSLIMVCTTIAGCRAIGSSENSGKGIKNRVGLPSPRTVGTMSVEEALFRRRSVREYSPQSLTLEEVSQLLWATQGVTSSQRGFRTAPSAGATFPMEIYLVVSRVDGLASGLYRYDPYENSVQMEVEGDLSRKLARAALDQYWVSEAAVNLVIAAVYERTTMRYGERGIRYVHMEAGHIGQNVYLQAEALGLGTVVVGAFHDEQVKKVLKIKEEPLYIMPVGRRR
ncbi:MAG TPA: SagB/ThcOx family dehydrogenase [Candidatus Latescibacteria bacterium]|nr:SagB/ThcOx family dehydrogenase [Candidatus Latescibacterota bacterium]